MIEHEYALDELTIYITNSITASDSKFSQTERITRKTLRSLSRRKKEKQPNVGKPL